MQGFQLRQGREWVTGQPWRAPLCSGRERDNKSFTRRAYYGSGYQKKNEFPKVLSHNKTFTSKPTKKGYLIDFKALAGSRKANAQVSGRNCCNCAIISVLRMLIDVHLPGINPV